MSTVSTTVKLGVVMLLFCLCVRVLTEENALDRKKRAFRYGASRRVSHGYGKKRHYIPSGSRLSESSKGPLENLLSIKEDAREGSQEKVEELTRLLAKHSTLFKILFIKCLDSEGDDFESPDSLSRHLTSKSWGDIKNGGKFHF